MKNKKTTIKEPVIVNDSMTPREKTLYTFNGTIPVTEAMAQTMAQELKTWVAEHPEALTIMEYYQSKDLTQEEYQDIVNKYPTLKRSHSIVMQKLGYRLWEGGVRHKWNWQAILFGIHNYGQEFKDNTKYFSQLKDAEALANTGIQLVYLKDLKETEEGVKYLAKKAAKK